MFVNGKKGCFIILKEHKPNFISNPKSCLLNPEKNELGKIATKVNQWKNTNDVISWFKSIKIINLILKIFTLQLLRNSYQNI